MRAFRLLAAFCPIALTVLATCHSERLLILPSIQPTELEAAPSASSRATRPPVPAEAPDPRDVSLLERCGIGDDSLHAQAAILARQNLLGQALPDSHELSLDLRMLGEPHVWPKAWTISPVDRALVLPRLEAWLSKTPQMGVRRCGITTMQDASSREVLSLVMVDALADVNEDIPMQVRPGSWLTLHATLLVPGSAATLVVLGPRGLPRTVPTSFDQSTRKILARFSADSSGLWFAQLLATVGGRPRPVLEFVVFAGVDAKSEVLHGEAPGELDLGQDDSVTVFQMLNAARISEGEHALVRDPKLDSLAMQHCLAMIKAGVIAHDAGDDSPAKRVADAGLTAYEVGENVAHAQSPRLAHRALWYSPSHRGNLLHPRYNYVGVAALRDGKNGVWITQLFARRTVP